MGRQSPGEKAEPGRESRAWARRQGLGEKAEPGREGRFMIDLKSMPFREAGGKKHGFPVSKEADTAVLQGKDILQV